MFTEFSIGTLRLPNRIVMAPMTRLRVGTGNTPTALNALYYAQRASCGLIISEAIAVSPQARGYLGTPGLYSPEQLLGWTHVVDAVHRAGGRMVAQLSHVGRVSHISVLPTGCAPVSATAKHVETLETFAIAVGGKPGKVAVSPPRALSAAGIADVVAQFARAASLARQAGFDGVEILAGNGYLIEEFLNAANNTRDDCYGGLCAENRCRVLIDILEAVAAELDDACPILVRLSPYGFFNCMPADPDVEETYLYLADRLRELGISCVHLNNERAPIGYLNDTANALAQASLQRLIPPAFVTRFKARFDGPMMLCGALDGDSARQLLRDKEIDLVAFGLPFVANPDLSERLRNHWPLAEPDTATLYAGEEQGYVDYPPYR